MKQWIFLALGCMTIYGCGGLAADVEVSAQLEQASRAKPDPVGLSLFFTNGVSPAKRLDGSAPRFVQELDIAESVPSATDRGIEPLISSSRLSALNWNGVEQVEEVWVPSLDGTFTRERYYRNARWMEQQSIFRLSALNAAGEPLGAKWIVRAGRDDRRRPSDTAFIRRFVARQSAVGCPSVGDCTGAAFVSEALVQLRGALRPDSDARPLPANTASLRLRWNRLPALDFIADVHLPTSEEAELGPGFRVELETVTAPDNGVYYVPGEGVTLRVTFRDGGGARLHPEGSLPTYGSFVAGQVASGLRYLDLQLQTRMYYALKHRESNLLVVLSGPTDEVRTPRTVVDPTLFFGPQVPFATTPVDGFTAVGQTIPPAAIIFGGLRDPSLWSVPISDTVTFTIPGDAEPGTYVAAIKARRDFAGEALNRGETLSIRVGQPAATDFVTQTKCTSCHSGERTNFGVLLHGISDRRACFGCHASLGIEFDNALDIRAHAVHDRSERFDGDMQDCSLCHVTPPDGLQRGVLP